MKKFSTYKGFTLVELMIVIAIIGILAAVLYPNLSGLINGVRDGAREASLKNIALALGTYQNANDRYPTIDGSKIEGCAADLKKALWSYGTNVDMEKNKNFGVKVGDEDCAKDGKGGFGYKLLDTETMAAADGAAYVIAARLEQPKKANITSGQFQKLTKTTGDDDKNVYHILEQNRINPQTYDATDNKLPYIIRAN